MRDFAIEFFYTKENGYTEVINIPDRNNKTIEMNIQQQQNVVFEFTEDNYERNYFEISNGFEGITSTLTSHWMCVCVCV